MRVWGPGKSVSENSMRISVVTQLEQSTVAGEIPLLSSLSHISCVLKAVRFILARITLLLWPDFELLLKVARRGASALHSTGPRPSNMHCLRVHTGTNMGQPEQERQRQLKETEWTGS